MSAAVSSTDKPRSKHVHPDDAALEQYSSVSRSAILAVVLGPISALVLVSPLLAIVPLAAIATAVVALRQIANSEGRLLGAWPATMGLCLAMLFLGWGLSRQVTREIALARQAQDFADGWLILVRDGKVQLADQLTRPPSTRVHGKEAIEELYSTNKAAGEEIESIFASDMLKDYVGAGSGASFALEGVTAHTQFGFTDDIVLKYTVRLAKPASSPKALWITVERNIDELNGLSGWRITRVEGNPPPDPGR